MPRGGLCAREVQAQVMSGVGAHQTGPGPTAAGRSPVSHSHAKALGSESSAWWEILGKQWGRGWRTQTQRNVDFIAGEVAPYPQGSGWGCLQGIPRWGVFAAGRTVHPALSAGSARTLRCAQGWEGPHWGGWWVPGQQGPEGSQACILGGGSFSARHRVERARGVVGSRLLGGLVSTGPG